MKWWVSVFILLITVSLSAQNRMVPITQTMKDFQYSSVEMTNCFPLFPLQNSAIRYYDHTKDTSIRFSSIGHYLFHRELIQLKDSTAKIWITPLFDLTLGSESRDTSGLKIQNTRGARVEGIFGNKFFFSTSFYENQAVLPSYQRTFVIGKGELYPNLTKKNYYQSNAVIPGGTRTKEFKVNGFDYTYAIGNVSYFPTPKWGIHWGNQPVFVGNGHRSLIWSDNSPAFMNNRTTYQPNKRWYFQSIHGRGFNLMRRAFATSVEANYEPKLFNISSVYFKPIESLTIGLNETSIWYRGDSVKSSSISPTFFIPLPFAGITQLAINDHKVATQIALDASLKVGTNWYYAQVTRQMIGKSNGAIQLGCRLFPLKKLPSWMLQLEWNYSAKNTAHGPIPRLNFSHYNLPVAHPLGDNFNELLLRTHIEFLKYWSVDCQLNIFTHSVTAPNTMLPVADPLFLNYQSSVNQYVEIAYNFNRQIGFAFFSSFRYRYADIVGPNYEHSWVSFGVRTSLNNHYFDF